MSSEDEEETIQKQNFSTKITNFQALPYKGQEIYARFEHYRSKSYAQALHSMSSTSVHNKSTLHSSVPIIDSDLMSPSQSAPATPKGNHIIKKSSTLPASNICEIAFPKPVKSNSSSLTNFLKKISPKIRRSCYKQKEKPWIVIEFSQEEIDGHISDSMESDHSVELALQGKEEYFARQKEKLHKKDTQNTRQRISRRSSEAADLCPFYSDDSDKLYNKKNMPPKRSKSEINNSSFFSRFMLKKFVSEQENYVSTKLKKSKAEKCSNRYRDGNVKPAKVNSKYKIHEDEFCGETKISETFKPMYSSLVKDSTKKSDFKQYRVNKNVQNLNVWDHCHYQKESQLGQKLKPCNSKVDAADHLVPFIRATLQKAQPPQSLNLRNTVHVHSHLAKNVANQMASVESIGACSLDVETTTEGGSSELKEDSAISDPSLTSKRMMLSCMSQNELDAGHRRGINTADDQKRQYTSHKSIYITSEKWESDGRNTLRPEWTLAELKLPSYINISCVVNGYTNFHRFCYSRDSSPAAFVKKDNLISDIPAKKAGEQDSSFCGSKRNNMQAHIEQRPCLLDNSHAPSGKLDPKYTDNKMQKILKPSHFIVADSVKRLYVNDAENKHLNGYKTEDSANGLVKVAIPPKSLIQQRIESLYGHEVAKVWKVARQKPFLHKPSGRSTVSEERYVSFSNRSPSCPPQALRARSKSPPVFRHLTKDFRDQLRALDSSNSPGAVTRVSRRTEKKSTPQSVSHNHFKTSFPNDAPCYNNQETNSDCLTRINSQVTQDSSKNLEMCQNSNDLIAQPCALAPVQKCENNLNIHGRDLNVESLNELVPLPKPERCNSLSSPEYTANAHLLPTPSSSSPTLETEMEERDGNWFLAALEKQKQQIEEKVLEVEKEMMRSDIPEDAAGKMRAAIGKANLLLSQKFEQFRGLCKKNLNQNLTEPFPTTVSDLAGFWDMVLLQVADVQDTLTNIEILKANNWQEKLTNKEDKKNQVRSKKTGKQRMDKALRPQHERSAKAMEAARTREEARKRLMEAKKKNRLKHNTKGTDVQVSIFVPENN
ncbi:uncharacterized protein LOC106469893 isoform X2 [Limulus polyphemus]|uniref:Uncharacterized protein LOC106469893 isoform X2 n=1 Tax=Limulus polyphemus TaxID=6850 RepID=A0ABM1TE71_LIMPO|nr:uncharacterized protein LOC106469893 isoform X2 [Limulus polyphemus]